MTRWMWFRIGGVLVALVCWAAPAAAQSPSPDNSYYVPQAGLDYGNPVDGDEAIPFFRACPNNDEGASLPFAARIKVVVKDSNGAPIPGISASSICIQLNGGTLVQGFSGLGADSVIANLLWNPVANCPDVRCIPADAATDVNGVAYITFTGPGGVRDPNRKWGHYDSEFPVFVSGVRISGRLTSSSTNGSYVLRIKNFDHFGGLAAILNLGEAVTAGDFNGVVASLGVHNAISYWRDFDGDGEVGVSDFNMTIWHFGHDCDSPNNP